MQRRTSGKLCQQVGEESPHCVIAAKHDALQVNRQGIDVQRAVLFELRACQRRNVVVRRVGEALFQ
ncbi:hypothetical protein D3C80_2016690 [compost metagenome]